jgi:hypothetical protein
VQDSKATGMIWTVLSGGPLWHHHNESHITHRTPQRLWNVQSHLPIYIYNSTVEDHQLQIQRGLGAPVHAWYYDHAYDGSSEAKHQGALKNW